MTDLKQEQERQEQQAIPGASQTNPYKDMPHFWALVEQVRDKNKANTTIKAGRSITQHEYENT